MIFVNARSLRNAISSRMFVFTRDTRSSHVLTVRNASIGNRLVLKFFLVTVPTCILVYILQLVDKHTPLCVARAVLKKQRMTLTAEGSLAMSRVLRSAGPEHPIRTDPENYLVPTPETSGSHSEYLLPLPFDLVRIVCLIIHVFYNIIHVALKLSSRLAHLQSK